MAVREGEEMALATWRPDRKLWPFAAMDEPPAPAETPPAEAPAEARGTSWWPAVVLLAVMLPLLLALLAMQGRSLMAQPARAAAPEEKAPSEQLILETRDAL